MYVWSGSAWVSVATEVESLANYATVNYASTQPGMKMIVPTSVTVGSGSGSVDTNGAVTFSGASSVSLNDVFSTSYDYYKIIISSKSPTSDGTLRLRLRVSGADDSTASYYTQAIGYTDFNATDNFRESALTSLWIGNLDSAVGGQLYSQSIEVYTPFQNTLETTFNMQNQVVTSASAGAHYSSGGFYVSPKSFTGFSIVTSAGNITGTLRVYGYKN
jgi:hypothetical protein